MCIHYNPIKFCSKVNTFAVRLVRFLLLFYLCFQMNVIAQLHGNDSLELKNKNWNEIKDDIDYTETYKDPKPYEPYDFDISDYLIHNSWVQIITAFFIIGLLGFLIYKLAGSNLFHFNKKIVNVIDYQLIDDCKDIHEMDLDTMLETVMKNQDYRMAIRIRFLMIIKHLHQKEFISWEKDKTNGEYISAMKQRSELSDFMFLVMIFERIWYGDVVLNIGDYTILSDYFDNFQQKINVQ